MSAPLSLIGFQGLNNSLDAHLIPSQVGVFAQDLEPGRDRFVPLKTRVARATVPAARKSLWRLGRDVINPALYWLSSGNEAAYARVFGNDPSEVTLIVGDGAPKWTDNTMLGTGGPYPQTTRPLAVPSPEAPTASLTADGTGTEGERFYVQVFATDRGWLSAPSSPSNPLTCKDGATVTLSNLGAPPSGNYGFQSRLIYVTQPGTGSDAEFFLIGTIPVAATSFVDTNLTRGALLETYDGSVGSAWTPLPDEATSVIKLWNGMHAAIAGKNLYICEPNVHYAWPDRYRRALSSPAVALGTWAQNCVVLTTAAPLVYQGVEPSSLQPMPGVTVQPCLSKRGAVSMENGVAWPSSDGLAWIGETGQRVLTKDILTPEQWRSLAPSTMIAARWRNFYVCSFNDGSLRGFMVDPERPETTFTWLSQGFDAAHYDELSQATFVVNGSSVMEFAAGAPMGALFISKRFIQSTPKNFGYVKVTANVFPVSVTVHARWQDPRDGAALTSTEVKVIEGPMAQSLRSRFLAESYQLEVGGANEVIAVRLASDPRHFNGQTNSGA